MLPSCWVCQWAECATPSGDVYCHYHKMSVSHSTFTFCPCLSGEREDWITAFISTEGIKGDDVYMWVEISYRVRDYPAIPQYCHEYVVLAPINVYAAWTVEECHIARRTLYEQKLKEFERQHSELGWHSD
jgi:hypothetical protein